MDQGILLSLIKDTLWTVIIVSAPLLLIALSIGLIVSIFQTVTSIQEPTLAFVPKILGVFIGLLIFGPFMMTRLKQLVLSIYTNFVMYIK